MNMLRYTFFILISTLYIGHNPLQASSNDDQSGLGFKNMKLRIVRIDEQANTIKQQNVTINDITGENTQLRESIDKLTQDNKQKDVKINELEKKQGGSSTGLFVGVGTVVAIVRSIAYLTVKAGDKDDNDIKK